MIGLLTKIKDALEADESLAAYVEAVDVRKWDPNSLPDFETYGIVISPEGRSSEKLAVREKQHICRVSIYCLVFEYDPTESLTGTGEGEEAKGILKLIEDVWDCLNGNDFGEYVEITGDELDDEIELNAVKSAERDGYFHEVEIRGMWRLLPFTD